ncbi:MAG: flagellar type III secretion system pore protein FliP [Brockia lithotrophica]|nr:flagellar type III secretion system pore protein FliP [Brockia lithotrophica]
MPIPPDLLRPETAPTAVQFLLLITVLSLAPAIVVLMTSFTRIVVVFALLRNALATQQVPPNQVLIGLALLLTVFIMEPTAQEVYRAAYVPYVEGRITTEEAIRAVEKPLKEFMAKSTRQKDLALFLERRGITAVRSLDEVPFSALLPAYVLSELTTAFQMGFLLYLPFLLIDLLVASVLMGMGMLMLPPVMISLPLKLLLFLAVDGWNLVVATLLRSFGG